jgi:membrane protease YdiL (CAAX protease family)
VRRLVEFIRSVIPADPSQLLLLGGVVCLTVAPRLHWWPAGLMNVEDHRGQSSGGFMVLSQWAVISSGLAGYFVCFWPGPRPLRRILCFVLAPAIAGLGLFVYQSPNLGKAASSVLETTSHAAHGGGWLQGVLWNLPAGVHFCLAGLFLIGIYTSRLAFGIAHLPLSLPGTPHGTSGDVDSWRRLQFLIWVLVGPLFLLHDLFALIALGLPVILLSQSPYYGQTAWFSRLFPIVGVLFVFSALVWVMGREARQVVRDTTRLPEPRHVVLGLAFPLGIAVFLSTGQYLLDRSLWTAHEFGKSSPPRFASYFDLPDPWFLLLFFSALFEEVIFRGVLQRSFIQRYGTYRGIFLVGIFWSAIHFVSDFSFSRLTEADVVLRLAWRILCCLALSYVLGWLTLRFGSILPAVAAHTFYNVLVTSEFGPPFQGKDTVLVALWAVLGWVLFHYWPVAEEGSAESAAKVANQNLAI